MTNETNAGETNKEFVSFRDKIGPYKRWYRFGAKSPIILYKRIRSQHRPIFKMRMGWQRAQRGWSDADTWGLHVHLAEVILGATRQMRKDAYGHPSEITFDEWVEILDQIGDGMEAALALDNTGEWPEGGEEKFKKAMSLLEHWWFGLWT